MTWVTITGAGTSTSSKFFGDITNKFSNMFNGTDVSDTVTINSAVVWTFEGTSLHLEGSTSTFDYIFTGAALTASRVLNFPLITGADTLATLGLPQTWSAVQTFVAPVLGTPTSGTLDADNLTFSNFAIGSTSEVGTALTETEEIWIPAGAYTSATTNGAEITSRETTTNVVNYTYAAFDTTTSQIVWFTWTPPANWDAGTVKYTLYWTNTSGLTTETIDFDLAGVALANDDAIDTAVGTAISVTDIWIAQGDLHITSQSTAITIAGTPVAGEEVHFKLSRDITDTLTGDADVIGINLEYSINDIGTT